MATTQQVTHFDLAPDFDLLVRPAHGGEMLIDPDGWKHYAWHVLLMSGAENMSYIYRTGTGLVEFDQDSGAPIIPDAHQIVESLAQDVAIGRNLPDLADFVEEFGYEDIRRAITVHAAGMRMFADFERVFPLHIDHFIDTYRED